MFAPKATPAAMQQTLREALAKAVQDADFRATMDKLETPIQYLDGPAFQKFWDADAKRLAVALKRIGRVEEKR